MSEGTITIKFGVGNQLVKPVADFPDVHAILSDSGIKLALNLPDNVEALVNNVVHTGSLRAGDVVKLQSKSNTKGS